MLRFVVRKMLNKKWMVLSLLIGNVLLISIAASNPMYTDAVLKRTLDSSLSNYIEETNKYPLTIRVDTTGVSTPSDKLKQVENLLGTSGEQMGLPVRELVCYYFLSPKQTETDMTRKDRLSTMALGFLSNLKEHIKLVDGEMPSEKVGENGVVDVLVSEKAYKTLQMVLGETITFSKYHKEDGSLIKFRVSGVFKEASTDDPYWVSNASFYSSVCLMDEKIFRDWFVEHRPSDTAIQGSWYVLYDYSDIQPENVPKILEGYNYIKTFFGETPLIRCYNNFEGVLNTYLKDQAKVETTFLVLQIPVFVLLAAFIIMVINQLLDMEQSEISVIKSRGASRSQIIGIYLTQSLVTTGISLALGIPLAVFLVKMLGSSSGFLEFVSRKSMAVRLSIKAILYALIAAAFAVLAMVIPVLKHSKVTIVNQKQKKNTRRSDNPLWQRLFLDIILLGLSIYGLFSFNNQKDILAQAVIEGKPLDPMLFISSSLFMLGAGLFLLRVLPFVIRGVFSLFKNKWSPAMYTSFIRVIRTRRQQGFIMAFLVMTIALGVFDASAARTISQNDERSLKYMTGADIVLQEKWRDNSLLVADDPSLELEYTEPDYGRFEQLSGAETVSKVYTSKLGSMNINNSTGSLTNVQIMGINTKEFGRIAWFDSSLISPHWYNYLNAMASRADAVLVSSNFKSLGYKINDVIYFRDNGTELTKGVIYGFVDYFPSYASTSYRLASDGTYKEQDNYLIVGNLAELQRVWGVLPYQIWMKNKDDSKYIYEFLQEKNIELKSFTDLSEELVKHKNDAILQGTYGILTVGWIVAMVVSAVGFLIYWILSIRSRELQFGIFRAMGMYMREIFTMLLNEQLWISVMSILAGALVGVLTSKFFMPLIQIAYSSSENALPLQVVLKASDNIRLGVVVGLVVIICLLILGWIVRKMKIAQALKLGED